MHVLGYGVRAMILAFVPRRSLHYAESKGGMTVLENATAILPAVDMDRAKRFYERSLGLTLGDESSSGVFFLCEDGSRVFLYPKEAGNKAEHTQVGWEVADIDEAVAELSGRGVRFERWEIPDVSVSDANIYEFDNARSAFFRDSEGNILSLIELR